jgi:protein ImuB
MFVTFYCPDIVTEQGTETRSVTLPVNLAQPTRSARHLGSLLAVLLERLSLPAPADALTLWARELDPLDDWQEELFTADSSDARQLGDLLDRLAVRLGRQAVVRPELVSDHQPERAFRYIECRNPYPPAPILDRKCVVVGGLIGPRLVRDKGAADEYRIMNSEGASVFPHSLRLRRTIRQSAIPNPQSATRNPQSAISITGPRPLRLSPRPIEIAATSIVPEGPPIAFCFQGRRYAVRETVGPERIETGWWRGTHVKRDYYRITTQSGRRCWLFRDRESDRWFLHGWFD